MKYFEQLKSWYQAKKAWVSAIIFVGTQVVAAWNLAAADEAITFSEAEGLYFVVIEAAGTILSLLGVYSAKNENPPTLT